MTATVPSDLRPARRRGRGDPEPGGGLRASIQVVGELLVTAGVVLLLFVVWQLFGTGLSTVRAQHALRAQLQQQWAQSIPGGSAGALPGTAGDRGAAGSGTVARDRGTAAVPVLRAPAEGKPLAELTIPRLSNSWVVVQGVNLDDLALGPGHYPGTALPGQIGNFAVAGHRATHDQPFAYLDQVRVGDRLIVTVATRVYVYDVTRTFLTQPTDLNVLAPVPNEPGVRPTQARITLTTCNPRWGHTQRLIVYGVLVKTLVNHPTVTRG